MLLSYQNAQEILSEIEQSADSNLLEEMLSLTTRYARMGVDWAFMPAEESRFRRLSNQRP